MSLMNQPHPTIIPLSSHYQKEDIINTQSNISHTYRNEDGIKVIVFVPEQTPTSNWRRDEVRNSFISRTGVIPFPRKRQS